MLMLSHVNILAQDCSCIAIGINLDFGSYNLYVHAYGIPAVLCISFAIYSYIVAMLGSCV